MASVGQIIEILGEIYPWELALEGDNSGLQVGSADSKVTRVLCTIDVTSGILDKAVGEGFDLIVSHHPIIYGVPLFSLDTGKPAGSILGRALRSGVSIVSCHTSADCAQGGTADLFAKRLRLVDAAPLEPAGGAWYVKVVVFVPPEALEEVSAAMAGAGAGEIGDYSHCSFRIPGRGTFLPGEKATPYTGEVGRLNVADEVRLEMLVPSFRVTSVVDAMLGKHPYEEVAYDLYRTSNPVPWGLGRIGELEEERTLMEIAHELADWCGAADTMLSGEAERRVKVVAVAPGSAGGLLDAACRTGAEVMVAGEVGYHPEVEASERGLSLICIGHLESERVLVPAMAGELGRLSAARGLEIEIEGICREGTDR